MSDDRLLPPMIILACASTSIVIVIFTRWLVVKRRRRSRDILQRRRDSNRQATPISIPAKAVSGSGSQSRASVPEGYYEIIADPSKPIEETVADSAVFDELGQGRTAEDEMTLPKGTNDVDCVKEKTYLDPMRVSYPTGGCADGSTPAGNRSEAQPMITELHSKLAPVTKPKNLTLHRNFKLNDGTQSDESGALHRNPMRNVFAGSDDGTVTKPMEAVSDGGDQSYTNCTAHHLPRKLSWTPVDTTDDETESVYVNRRVVQKHFARTLSLRQSKSKQENN